MRQKRIKGVDIALMKSLNVITEPTNLNLKGHVFLEIGSGKGNFITTLALDNPENTYIAVEKNINVCYRIAQKKQENSIDNLHILLVDSLEILNFIPEKSIDHIFLSFSDPWPKAKHHKRRLTYSNFLKIYKKILKNDGIFQLRTDHLDFFNDSIEYIEKEFDIYEIDYDYKSDKYVTEYEIKKSKHTKINQLKGRVKQ